MQRRIRHARFAPQMQPDGGTLSVAPGLRMEVLEQIPHYPEGTTVEQVMRTGFAPLRDMEAQLAALRAFEAEALS